MQTHTQWMPVGYLYWTTLHNRNGARQVGAEMRGVMDDFGTLVPIG